MPKKNEQDILINVLLDRSGSMGGLESDVIGQYNKYIEEQRALPGRALVSLVLFDDRYEEVYIGRDIREVPELTSATYRVRGSTAYLDAIGRLIRSVDALKDKPKKVVFVVNTDGLENASREYTLESIRKTVEERTSNHDWQFVFVGAGLDKTAIERAVADSGFGSYFNTVGASGQSIGAGYSALRSATTGYRSGINSSLNLGNVTITEDEEEEVINSGTQASATV